LLTLILDKSFPPSEPFATLDCHIAACVGKTLQASHLEDGCSFARDNRTRCGNKISEGTLMADQAITRDQLAQLLKRTFRANIRQLSPTWSIRRC